MDTIKITAFGAEQFKAYLKSNTGAWGIGLTVQAAIGDLVFSYPELFNITGVEGLPKSFTGPLKPIDLLRQKYLTTGEVEVINEFEKSLERFDVIKTPIGDKTIIHDPEGAQG